jgi:uncharacterized membrane protein
VDIEKLANSMVTGLLGVMLVGAAVYESITTGEIEAGLLGMTTAVVAVYFTGRANKQVNGEKVDALTKSVGALHARLDPATDPDVAFVRTQTGENA